jgi:hypothetical protein
MIAHFWRSLLTGEQDYIGAQASNDVDGLDGIPPLHCWILGAWQE